MVILAVRSAAAAQTPQEMRNALYVKHIRPYLESRSNSLCTVINQRILLLFRDQNRYEVLTLVNQIRGELESAYAPRCTAA